MKGNRDASASGWPRRERATPLLLAALLLAAVFSASCLYIVEIPPLSNRPFDAVVRAGAADGGGEYVVQAGDTMGAIAGKVMGSSAKWRELWEMNPEIEDPNLLQVGQRLRTGEPEPAGPPRLADLYLMTTGDIDRPYEVIGFTMVTVQGTYTLGVIKLKSSSAEEVVFGPLIEEMEEQGADGIIHLHFDERKARYVWRIVTDIVRAASGLAQGNPANAFSFYGTIAQGELIRFTDVPTGEERKAR